MQNETLVFLGIIVAVIASLFMLFRYLLKKAEDEDEKDHNEVEAMTDEELRTKASIQTAERRHPSYLAQLEVEANKRGIHLSGPIKTVVQEREELENAKTNIHIAFILALVISVGHPLYIFFSTGSITPSSLVASATYVGLCVGVFLKSRIAAILLLFIFGVNLLFALAIANQQISWLSLFFLSSFIYAVTATFTYHSQKEKLKEIANGPPIQ